MNSGQETEKRGKARANRTSKSELSEKAKPLFVCGCDRSGTTAFADCLNQHPEILTCQERYKMGTPLARITPAHFTFERIADFRPEETKRPIWKNGSEFFVKYHTELLAKKDPAKLRWIGDKGPFYVRGMDVLAGNNPGARFIVLYRPIEEVIESWEARAKDPDDHWNSERGAEEAVKTWNMALTKTREFIESSPAPRLLIIGYHDFFYRNEAVVPLVSRFLGLEFDESVTQAWREASLEFESRRRRKEPLSEEQRSFIREHANRDAEAWVLERIEKQWREPGLYVEESEEVELASLDKMEARVWQLKWRLEKLQEQNQREVEKLNRRLARTKKKNRDLANQLRGIRASRSWRLLNKLDRLQARALGTWWR